MMTWYSTFVLWCLVMPARYCSNEVPLTVPIISFFKWTGSGVQDYKLRLITSFGTMWRVDLQGWATLGRALSRNTKTVLSSFPEMDWFQTKGHIARVGIFFLRHLTTYYEFRFCRSTFKIAIQCYKELWGRIHDANWYVNKKAKKHFFVENNFSKAIGVSTNLVFHNIIYDILKSGTHGVYCKDVWQNKYVLMVEVIGFDLIILILHRQLMFISMNCLTSPVACTHCTFLVPESSEGAVRSKLARKLDCSQGTFLM